MTRPSPIFVQVITLGGLFASMMVLSIICHNNNHLCVAVGVKSCLTTAAKVFFFIKGGIITLIMFNLPPNSVALGYADLNKPIG
jgi:hypothetical protein